MLCTVDDVRRYAPVGDDDQLREAQCRAEVWVSRYTLSRSHVSSTPEPPVREAAALLTALIYTDTGATLAEADVPNAVRLMLLPWT